jgi:hypothetical protein
VLDAVKEYIKITWDDEDSNLLAIIDRCQAKLNGLTGTELDFENNKAARGLLLDYCRYTYNNASEYFEENYQKEIRRLQLTEAVKASVEQQDQ